MTYTDHHKALILVVSDLEWARTPEDAIHLLDAAALHITEMSRLVEARHPLNVGMLREQQFKAGVPVEVDGGPGLPGGPEGAA
jgi:hypothetical protein